MPTPPYTEKQILDGERETLGLYLSSHPVSRYLKELFSLQLYTIKRSHAKPPWTN